MTTYQAGGGEEQLVHDWRVDRLTRLGVPGSLAEAYADRLERGRRQILALHTRGVPLAPGVDLDVLAAATPAWSGRT